MFFDTRRCVPQRSGAVRGEIFRESQMRFATFGLPSGNVFLPSQMQCVAFGRRSGEISRRSPMRFCFPLTCLNHLVGERLPSSTRQQKCGGTREHSRMCASTQQRAPSAQLACKPHFPVERKVVNTFPSSSVALRACRDQQECGGAREHQACKQHRSTHESK